MIASIRELFDSAAHQYDRARRRLVPCFDEFYRAALDSLHFEKEREFTVLDLGAGTGILSALIAYSFPRVRITLLDISRAMLAQAQERFAAGGDRFSFVHADYETTPIQGRYDAIVSALSIHLSSDPSKRTLFRKIREALNPGGAFVNADQVRGETALIERLTREAWFRRVMEVRPDESDLRSALSRMELDHDAPLEIQLDWLRELGFREVVCSYRNMIFAVYSGLR